MLARSFETLTIFLFFFSFFKISFFIFQEKRKKEWINSNKQNMSEPIDTIMYIFANCSSMTRSVNVECPHGTAAQYAQGNFLERVIQPNCRRRVCWDKGPKRRTHVQQTPALFCGHSRGFKYNEDGTV